MGIREVPCLCEPWCVEHAPACWHPNATGPPSRAQASASAAPSGSVATALAKVSDGLAEVTEDWERRSDCLQLFFVSAGLGVGSLHGRAVHGVCVS